MASTPDPAPELIEKLDDRELQARLFPAPPPVGSSRPVPDWAEVHRELRRKV